MAHSVIIYSTPSCPYCKILKKYLTENNIAFQDIDVQADPSQAQAMIDKSGQLGVPVVEIDGKIIIGFNKPEIAKILGLPQ
ncbi:glutaredoxin family protein [Candidatus Saganbacteria bacterium]|nr:glutaredoxin family protein [Candidatus Saganbacteria bacterium]